MNFLISRRADCCQVFNYWLNLSLPSDIKKCIPSSFDDQLNHETQLCTFSIFDTSPDTKKCQKRKVLAKVKLFRCKHTQSNLTLQFVIMIWLSCQMKLMVMSCLFRWFVPMKGWIKSYLASCIFHVALIWEENTYFNYSNESLFKCNSNTQFKWKKQVHSFALIFKLLWEKRRTKVICSSKMSAN